MSKPARRVVHMRVPSPPVRRRSVSTGPASSRPRVPSKAPQDSDSTDQSDEESSLTSFSDGSDDNDGDTPQHTDENVMKIAKPAGEVGCPNRGGYKLEDVIQWNTSWMRIFKSLINRLVDEHLDAMRSFMGQSDKQLHMVHDEAVKFLPDLGTYDQEWPVTDAVKLRLKYTSAKARQHAQDAVSMATKKTRVQRK
ncbi:hypothetical protein OBBRIDRAFT_839551 [Obba rivulosa]|uniref:Uncharacterized protein n=1 Tax=Obba rivulosa TaxID=1052685 RepID=A0A8E2AMG2_9APHY|nr:hypothetical protein OBBRIDRAFT_839551 [Obba rivulosa]